MYEWFYVKMQKYFREACFDLHYIVTDCFIFSFKLIKYLIEDLKHFNEDVDLNDSDQSHELYSEDNENKFCGIEI